MATISNEQKIKTLKNGQEFKNLRELCDFLQIPYSNSGNQRKALISDLKQYISYSKQGHKITIDEVYDIKHLKEDRRTEGNHSIYQKYIEPIIIYHLVYGEYDTFDKSTYKKAANTIGIYNYPLYFEKDKSKKNKRIIQNELLCALFSKYMKESADKIEQHSDVYERYLYKYVERINTDISLFLKTILRTCLNKMKKNEIVDFFEGDYFIASSYHRHVVPVDLDETTSALYKEAKEYAKEATGLDERTAIYLGRQDKYYEHMNTYIYDNSHEMFSRVAHLINVIPKNLENSRYYQMFFDQQNDNASCDRDSVSSSIQELTEKFIEAFCDNSFHKYVNNKIKQQKILLEEIDDGEGEEIDDGEDKELNDDLWMYMIDHLQNINDGISPLDINDNLELQSRLKNRIQKLSEEKRKRKVRHLVYYYDDIMRSSICLQNGFFEDIYNTIGEYIMKSGKSLNTESTPDKEGDNLER